jgi:hypothetical protein
MQKMTTFSEMGFRQFASPHEVSQKGSNPPAPIASGGRRPLTLLGLAFQGYEILSRCQDK